MKKLFYSVAMMGLLAACGSPQMSSHNHTIPSAKLAEIAAMSGDPVAAEQMYATAAQDRPRDADAQLTYANALVSSNKINEARQVLANGIQKVSNPAILHGPLGSLYVLTGETQQAVVEFDAALSADHNNVRWLTNKAIALDMLSRHGDAQALYKLALASTPNDPIILSNYGLSLALSGQKDEALRVMAPLSGQTNLSPRIANTIEMVRSDKIGKAG